MQKYIYEHWLPAVKAKKICIILKNSYPLNSTERTVTFTDTHFPTKLIIMLVH